MRLSTFSSRWFLLAGSFLVFSALGVGANVALSRLSAGNEPYDVRSDRFFFKKIEPAKYPAVIYGDSRTYRGVATPIVSAALGAPAMNLAFSGSGINAEMLAFIDEHLDHEAAERFVIFGITPWMFTEKSRDNEHFHEIARKFSRRTPSEDQCALHLFDRIALKKIKEHFSERTSERFDVENFRADGWCPTVLAHPEEKAEWVKRGLEGYVALFKATKFSKASMAEFRSRVGDWVSRGVHVFVFRIPSCREMVELEDSMSGFDEKSFKRAVKELGAIWIEMDVGGYESYDASHITADSARRMTRDLVDKMLHRGDERPICSEGRTE